MRKTSRILILGIVYFFPLITFGQLVINEFSSKGSIKDFDGKTNDWIELINTSSNPINSSNYSITSSQSSDGCGSLSILLQFYKLREDKP